MRIFPDRLSPEDQWADDRRKVDLVATLDPRVSGKTVYLKVWDVDDPFDQLNPNMPDVGIIDADASGPAQWNVRRGVQELIRLFECREVLADTRMLRDEAGSVFRHLNDRNGWGFQAPELDRWAEAQSSVDVDQRVAQYTERIKKWFAENEQRFPDWKLGDPLPEAVPSEKSESNDKKP